MANNPIIITLPYTADLDRGPVEQYLPVAFGTGDKEAHKLILTAYRATGIVDLTGAGVLCYVNRADKTTVVVDGEVVDGKAIVVLPEECYIVNGVVSIIVKLTMGDTRTTALWLNGNINRTRNGKLVDPGGVVPSLEELLAQIDNMVAATNDAAAAADEARQVAAEYDSKVAEQDGKIAELTDNAKQIDKRLEAIEGIRYYSADAFVNGLYSAGVGITASEYNIASRTMLPVAAGDTIIIKPNGLYVQCRIWRTEDIGAENALVNLGYYTEDADIMAGHTGYLYAQVTDPAGQRITPNDYVCEIGCGVMRIDELNKKMQALRLDVDQDKVLIDNSIAALSEEIDDLKGSGGAADAVRYTEQTLTDAQKTQARMNLWQQVPSENLFNKETVVVGEYLAPTGEAIASANLRYSYVPLTGAGTYACAVPGSKLGFSNGNYKRIPIYDAGKNYLMTIEGTSNDTTSAVNNKVVFVVSDADISNGAAYMGFNVEKTMLDSVMVVKSGSYPERYIPYSPTIGIPEFGISVESVRAFEVNPLYGKIATFTGDSICEARENNGGGYATLIGNRNAMVVENLGVSGGRITVGTEKFCITESVNSMRTDADYVILEGGVNDAAANNLGEISDNFNATLDTATFCGAFEQMVKNAIARFPGKKIGYIAVHRLKQWAPDDYNTNFPNTGYYEAAINICKKWGVPVCDLTTNCPSLYEIDSLKQAYTTNADGWHPNEEGYLKYYVPKIEAWMKTL